MLIKHLCMGLKPEPFPGTVIDKPGDLGEPLVSDILKGRPFRKVLPEQAVGVLVRPTLRRSVGVTEGLIFKPCKCNNRQSFDNTKITAKQGNAEERPDAGCKIYGESSGRKVAAFFSSPVSFKRINLGGSRAEPSSAVRLPVCPQRKS